MTHSNSNVEPPEELPLIGNLHHHLTALANAHLWIKVLIGMAAGIITGVALGPTTGWLSPDTATVVGNWLAFPGQLFLTLIQMIVIPLVFASIVMGLAASENIQQLKQMGLKSVLFFVVTTAVATAIGIGMAYLLKPGDLIDKTLLQQDLGSALHTIPQSAQVPSIAELPNKVLLLLPSNPLSSMVEGQMLQVLLFAMIFGVALLTLAPGKSRPLLEVLGSLQEVCMTVVRWAMRLAPFAVFGLIAQLTAKIGFNALIGMGAYVGTVLGGLLLMLMIYLLLAFIITGIGPQRFLSAVREVMLLAFSTSSSAAVMPLSIKTAVEKLGVRQTIAQFVIPLGTTINMNGTALYQGAATVFLAQVFGVDLSVGGIVLVVLMAVGASIGSPATPGVGIIILAMVLKTVGIPVTGIALIIGVDRILDMSRTAINVCGDILASKVMDRWVD
tara:strand:+ start:4526 stop:5857 length:1332 start_codon:yes stop_codon:yes gene_type:complete